MRKRKSKKLNLRPTVRIYCEGKTEENYFNMLKKKYRQSNVYPIKIKSMARSGMTLLHDVLEDPKLNKHDKIYLVFDRDEHDNEELLKCFDQARKSPYDITILFSSICFEIWILMHFESVNANYERKQLFNKLSGKKYFDEEYSRNKGEKIDILYDKVGTAVKNANRISSPADKSANASTKIIRSDPYTNINLYLKDIFQTEQY